MGVKQNIEFEDVVIAARDLKECHDLYCPGDGQIRSVVHVAKVKGMIEVRVGQQVHSLYRFAPDEKITIMREKRKSYVRK